MTTIHYPSEIPSHSATVSNHMRMPPIIHASFRPQHTDSTTTSQQPSLLHPPQPNPHHPTSAGKRLPVADASASTPASAADDVSSSAPTPKRARHAETPTPTQTLESAPTVVVTAPPVVVPVPASIASVQRLAGRHDANANEPMRSLTLDSIRTEMTAFRNIMVDVAKAELQMSAADLKAEMQTIVPAITVRQSKEMSIMAAAFLTLRDETNAALAALTPRASSSPATTTAADPVAAAAARQTLQRMLLEQKVDRDKIARLQKDKEELLSEQRTDRDKIARLQSEKEDAEANFAQMRDMNINLHVDPSSPHMNDA